MALRFCLTLDLSCRMQLVSSRGSLKLKKGGIKALMLDRRKSSEPFKLDPKNPSLAGPRQRLGTRLIRVGTVSCKVVLLSCGHSQRASTENNTLNSFLRNKPAS